MIGRSATVKINAALVDIIGIAVDGMQGHTTSRGSGPGETARRSLGIQLQLLRRATRGSPSFPLVVGSPRTDRLEESKETCNGQQTRGTLYYIPFGSCFFVLVFFIPQNTHIHQQSFDSSEQCGSSGQLCEIDSSYT